jgi:hypothetical protein
MTKLTDHLFSLLRFSIHEGRSTQWPPPMDGAVDWEQLFALAARHGTVLLTYPAIQQLPPREQPPRKLKLRWVANVVKGNERAVHYRQAVADLSRLLFENGIDTLILKGLTVAALYPVPSYREGGDIDIYLFGEAAKANALVASLGIEVHHTSSKHSAFAFEGVMVENHRRFFDTDSLFAREAALYKKIEHLLTAMFSREGSPRIGVGTACELPPQAAALFLVGHTFRHFCGGDLNARHLCDWVVVFERLRDKIDFGLLESQIVDLGLERFVGVINSFCVKYLGFEPRCLIGDCDKRSERLVRRMLTAYRRPRKFRIPIVGSLRHIFLRNHIYNRYLTCIAPSEFLLPELRRYFAWLLKRLRGGRHGS